MDVRCPRCGTEYEFDDALVSERGTTVKCTNCTHQFKVRAAGSAVPERWIVRTQAGRELVYTSLRDLQRGITHGQVTPEDVLSRGNQPPRALGSIAELDPFFVRRSGGRASANRTTLSGVPPPASGAAPAPPPPPPTEPEVEGPTLTYSPALPPAPAEAARAPAPAPAPAPALVAAPAPAAPSTAPPAPTPSIRTSISDAAGVPSLPPRKQRSRWIVGVVLLLGAGLLAGTVGRQYLERFRAAPAASPATAADPRLAELVALGQRLLADGDLDGAKEALDKASVLGDRNPEVLAALATWHAVRADQRWLELRLLDPKGDDRVRSVHRELGRLVGRAQQALDAAVAVSPDAPAVQRARVDVARLAGDLASARERVAPLSGGAADPLTAYTLAALDLAETSPVWPTVLERLRAAAASERGLGRARSALVYALARSGDVTAAEVELGKLEELSRASPLVAALEAYLGRLEKAVQDAGSLDAAAPVATVDPATLPKLDTTPRADPEDTAAGAAPPAGDFRSLLAQASAAAKAGDYDRAERLYRTVLAQQPDNTEALSGLGDVARAKKDPATAARMYDKVLQDNPGYLPALLAKADAQWDAGDRQSALVLYRRILEQAGPGTSYGQRAAARLAQGAQGGSGSAPTATATATVAPTATATERPTPPPDQPEIDTSDLPGHQ